MFLRGARIAKQLEEYLAESTFADLERNTNAFTPPSTKRQHATNPVQIRQLELVPYEGALGVNGSVNSIESGSQYQPQMMFLEVEYIQPQEGEDAEAIAQDPNTVTFQAADGKDYTIRPISLARNNVKVRCTCLDFRWRFSIYNDKDGSLLGNGPGLYQKKTDRAPNNPQQTPGVCKHLLKLTAELKANGVVSP